MSVYIQNITGTFRWHDWLSVGETLNLFFLPLRQEILCGAAVKARSLSKNWSPRLFQHAHQRQPEA